MLLINLCDSSDRDGHSMTRVHFVALYIQRQSVQRDPEIEEKDRICYEKHACISIQTDTQSESYLWICWTHGKTKTLPPEIMTGGERQNPEIGVTSCMWTCFMISTEYINTWGYLVLPDTTIASLGPQVKNIFTLLRNQKDENSRTQLQSLVYM